MPELINAHFSHGLLVVTESLVLTTGTLRQSMLRSELVGVKLTITAKPRFGFGGRANLLFHSQTEVLRADGLKLKDARQIMQMLGY